VAIRVPESSMQNRRLEHRVPGSDVNLVLVLERMIAAVEFGMKEALEPPEKIYGLAFESQYGLEKIMN
jgi:glutamine synthetase